MSIEFTQKAKEALFHSRAELGRYALAILHYMLPEMKPGQQDYKQLLPITFLIAVVMAFPSAKATSSAQSVYSEHVLKAKESIEQCFEQTNPNRICEPSVEEVVQRTYPDLY